ncbi:hypothetical protein ACFQPF_04535 [Fictibacillus iocasae]|uniref:Uncharacterized protein n=1 Tax=Fictibacillus iocasae TaxID=2715437 RepID=A0ABW2NNQ9_9BACL
MAMDFITYDTRKNMLCSLPISYSFHKSIFYGPDSMKLNNESYPHLFKLRHYHGHSVEYFSSDIACLIKELKNYCRYIHGHQQKAALLMDKMSDPLVWKVEFTGD